MDPHIPAELRLTPHLMTRQTKGFTGLYTGGGKRREEEGREERGRRRRRERGKRQEEEERG